MTGCDPVPGRWPTLSPAAYARLVRLARRRLVGREHAAEDVVSIALMKWVTIDEAVADRARIEQVVRSEAASWRRGEDRRRAREERVASDRSRSPYRPAPAELELRFIKHALDSTAKREGISVERQDLEILTSLLDGIAMSEISRQTGLSRSAIKRSRQRWQLIWHIAGLDQIPP